MVKKYGILRLLRKGLAVDDAHFTLFYVAPLQNSSQRIKDNFEKNQFSVTRQLRYSASNPLEEIDMVIFINGIPISTIELKNHWTGQNAKVHGINQYKFKRDITQPLLNFGRCIVHFALDRSEEHTSELQSRPHLVCRLLHEKINLIQCTELTDEEKKTLCNTDFV